MSRKVLITGGEGQLGTSLQTSLANNFNVLVTTRDPSDKNIVNHNVIKMNIIDQDNVFKVVGSFQPDIIINCAAFSDVDGNEIDKKLSHEVNVKGLANILQSISKESHFIQISSDYVFDGTSGPYSETDHTFPINNYGKTKLEAENFIRGSRNKWTIIRPNVIYSEDLFCKSNFFAWVYKSLIKNQSIPIVTDQISNPSYAKYLSESIFQCILMGYEGILHFGSDNYISRYEFAIEIAEIFSLDKSLISPITTDELSREVDTYIAKRPKHTGLNVSKIEKELNLSTYSTSYSLKDLKNTLE